MGGKSEISRKEKEYLWEFGGGFVRPLGGKIESYLYELLNQTKQHYDGDGNGVFETTLDKNWRGGELPKKPYTLGHLIQAIIYWNIYCSETSGAIKYTIKDDAFIADVRQLQKLKFDQIRNEFAHYAEPNEMPLKLIKSRSDISALYGAVLFGTHFLLRNKYGTQD